MAVHKRPPTLPLPRRVDAVIAEATVVLFGDEVESDKAEDFSGVLQRPDAFGVGLEVLPHLGALSLLPGQFGIVADGLVALLAEHCFITGLNRRVAEDSQFIQARQIILARLA
jgi:hypothetical protein